MGVLLYLCYILSKLVNRNNTKGLLPYLEMSLFYFLGIIGESKTIYYQKSYEHAIAVIVEEKLAITLRYLATGESLNSLKYQFRIHETTTGKFIVPVCEAITKFWHQIT